MPDTLNERKTHTIRARRDALRTAPLIERETGSLYHLQTLALLYILINDGSTNNMDTLRCGGGTMIVPVAALTGPIARARRTSKQARALLVEWEVDSEYDFITRRAVPELKRSNPPSLPARSPPPFPLFLSALSQSL